LAVEDYYLSTCNGSFPAVFGWSTMFVDDVADDLGLGEVFVVIWVCRGTATRWGGGRCVVDYLEVFCAFEVSFLVCPVVFCEVGERHLE
jgi:hypothetical protein